MSLLTEVSNIKIKLKKNTYEKGKSGIYTKLTSNM